MYILYFDVLRSARLSCCPDIAFCDRVDLTSKRTAKFKTVCVTESKIFILQNVVFLVIYEQKGISFGDC